MAGLEGKSPFEEREVLTFNDGSQAFRYNLLGTRLSFDGKGELSGLSGPHHAGIQFVDEVSPDRKFLIGLGYGRILRGGLSKQVQVSKLPDVVIGEAWLPLASTDFKAVAAYVNNPTRSANAEDIWGIHIDIDAPNPLSVIRSVLAVAGSNNTGTR